MLHLARGIVISAALVFVCWWVLQGSSSFQTCIQQDQKQSANNHPENYISTFAAGANTYRDCLGEFVHDRKDEILVAFTVILAFSTIFLWVATRDLVESAERTAKRQLRAYVGVDEVSIKVVERDKKPFIYVRIKNYGQTPAYSLRYWADIIIAPTFPDQSAFKDRTWCGESVLDPGSVFGIYSQKTDALLPDEADAIGRDTKRIYFMARIVYRDAFGKKRHTDIRQECGGTQLIGMGRMENSEKGNRQT